MMMGREVTLPIDLVFGKHTDQEPKSLPDYVEDFINRIEKVHEVVMFLVLLMCNLLHISVNMFDVNCAPWSVCIWRGRP
jgi:hypothetical protein